jgi:hypothetical protein
MLSLMMFLNPKVSINISWMCFFCRDQISKLKIVKITFLDPTFLILKITIQFFLTKSIFILCALSKKTKIVKCAFFEPKESKVVFFNPRDKLKC